VCQRRPRKGGAGKLAPVERAIQPGTCLLARRRLPVGFHYYHTLAMAPSEGMSRESQSVLVTRLRVSYVATRIHDDLVLGQPEMFAELFVAPRPVQGVQLGLPFGPQAPVDAHFWGSLAEWRPREQLSIEDGRKLRRAGVPLRHRGGLAAKVEGPRLELHVHPFGVVALTTIDLMWPESCPLSDVWTRVGQMRDLPARATVGGESHETEVAAAAPIAAEVLLERLARMKGSTWEVPDHRIATVIDGSVHGVPIAMPPARGPVHIAVHRLSAGGDVIPEPGSAFVAQWSGAGFAWAPARLVYMLDAGTSIVSPAEVSSRPSDPGVSLGARHRRAALLLGHVTASVGLVRAAPKAASMYFQSWAKTAADRLGRLYGPATANDDWGLETRSYLTRLGAVQDIGTFRGSPLTEKYPSPPYP
jgi:hypothetical protein